MANPQVWYQANEPTDMTPGTQWILADGTWRVRGIDGAWRGIGNVNLDNAGSVKRSGDSMDGALQGAHGLAPLHDPNFISSTRLENATLVTDTWVQTKLDDLNTALREKIASVAKGGNTASALIASNLAFGWGNGKPSDTGNPHRSLLHGDVVPLPSYVNADGSKTPASKSEIVFLSVSPRHQDHASDAGGTAPTVNHQCTVDPMTLVVTVGVTPTQGFDMNTEVWDRPAGITSGSANYGIICMRS